MNKVSLEKLFKEQVDNYLKDISLQNFSSKYDGLKDIVLKINNQGIPKTTILKVLNSSKKRSPLNDYQEEVLIEILNCILGQTHPQNKISLIN